MKEMYYSNISPDGKNSITVDRQYKAGRAHELHTPRRGYVSEFPTNGFLPELGAGLALEPAGLRVNSSTASQWPCNVGQAAHASGPLDVY